MENMATFKTSMIILNRSKVCFLRNRLFKAKMASPAFSVADGFNSILAVEEVTKILCITYYIFFAHLNKI